MTLKLILIALALLIGVLIVYTSHARPQQQEEPAIDQRWWAELSQEWKIIFLINQHFKTNGIDVFAIHRQYINRMNVAGESDYSEMNKSMYEMNTLNRFNLGYSDLYARAVRYEQTKHQNDIDLETLSQLDTFYMVNGPGDLTPLKKLPLLNVLILNDCGIGDNVPVKEQLLDLSPLTGMKELKILHCSSSALRSLKPIRDLINLEELVVGNSRRLSLKPIKKLKKLKKLSICSSADNLQVISGLRNLEDLSIHSIRKTAQLKKLKKLKKLSIAEDEMAIVNASYRIKDIRFLKALTSLEFLDLRYTSYHGDLSELTNLKNLKAITLPSVSRAHVDLFRQVKKTVSLLILLNFNTNIQPMWKLFKWSSRLTITLLGLVFFRCGSGDAKKKGTITFHGLQFKAGDFIELNGQFGKTSTTAYYKSKAFSYADVASFIALDEHYAKDKDTVYYCDEYREGQNYYLTKKQTLLTVQNADPLTFVSLQHGYARDWQHAYFEGVSFQVKDPATFTAIDTHFAKDTIQAYLNRIPIAGSDGNTFQLIGDHFAKDKNHIYYYGYTGEGQHNIVMLPGDPEEFEILDYRYSKDKANVYFLGFKIKEANPASFTLLDESYAKDNRFVYYEERRVTGADALSFEVYKENGELGHDVCYARDSTSVYMNERKLTQADVHSFQVLGENYGRDSRNVYYKTNIVKKALAESFKVYPHTMGNADAEDVKNKFYEGVVVSDK